MHGTPTFTKLKYLGYRNKHKHNYNKNRNFRSPTLEISGKKKPKKKHDVPETILQNVTKKYYSSNFPYNHSPN